MADAAGVHQLHEHLATLGVDRIDDGLPAAHLRVVEEPRDARIAQAVGRRRRALGNDQTGRGPLAVVLGHQGVGRVGIDRAIARHWRHDGAVGKPDRRCDKGFEEHGGPLGVGDRGAGQARCGR